MRQISKMGDCPRCGVGIFHKPNCKLFYRKVLMNGCQGDEHIFPNLSGNCQCGVYKSVEEFKKVHAQDAIVKNGDVETVESLTQQLELVKKGLKIAKAVGENTSKALVTELEAQRKYITHLEKRCNQMGVKIFVDEARDEVSYPQGQTPPGVLG